MTSSQPSGSAARLGLGQRVAPVLEPGERPLAADLLAAVGRRGPRDQGVDRGAGGDRLGGEETPEPEPDDGRPARKPTDRSASQSAARMTASIQAATRSGSTRFRRCRPSPAGRSGERRGRSRRGARPTSGGCGTTRPRASPTAARSGRAVAAATAGSAGWKTAKNGSGSPLQPERDRRRRHRRSSTRGRPDRARWRRSRRAAPRRTHRADGSRRRIRVQADLARAARLEAERVIGGDEARDGQPDPVGVARGSEGRDRRPVLAHRTSPLRPISATGRAAAGRPSGNRNACDSSGVRPPRSPARDLRRRAMRTAGPKRYDQPTSTNRPSIASTSRSIVVPASSRSARRPRRRGLVVLVDGHPQARIEGCRAVVRDVDADSVQALVSHPHRHRSERPAQVVPGHLRQAAMVEDAPARAGPLIAQPQHEPAAGGRAGSTPLAEDLGHHLARHRARRARDSAGVRARSPPGRRRKLGQVVIANVLEVPRRPRSRGTAAFQRGGPRDVAEVAASARVVGNVREGQALGSEPDVGEPDVGRAAGDTRRRRSSGRSRRRSGTAASPPVGVDGTTMASQPGARRAGHDLVRRTGRGRLAGRPSIAACCSISLLPQGPPGSAASRGGPASCVDSAVPSPGTVVGDG